jgi:hypothetical protein
MPDLVEITVLVYRHSGLWFPTLVSDVTTFLHQNIHPYRLWTNVGSQRREQ